MAKDFTYQEMKEIAQSSGFKKFHQENPNSEVEDYINTLSDEEKDAWSDFLAPAQKPTPKKDLITEIDGHFEEMAVSFEYPSKDKSKEKAVTDFLTERNKILAQAANPAEVKSILDHIDSRFKEDDLLYGNEFIKISDELKNSYKTLSEKDEFKFEKTEKTEKTEQKQPEKTEQKTTSQSSKKVIDLSTITNFKHIDEVIRALQDEDFKSKFNDEVVAALKLRVAGDMDGYTAAITKLQAAASEKDLNNVAFAMDDKGYMYGYKEVPAEMQTRMVIDLDSLDRYKETGEVINALLDDDFASDFSREVAEALKLKKAGKIDDYKRVITDLQNRATDEQLKNIGQAMDDKGYMYNQKEVPAKAAPTKTRSVIDLRTIDRYKEIGEVINALNDDDYASDFNREVAAALELKKAGKIDDYNKMIDALQTRGTDEQFKNLGLSLDDKGYMYDKKQVPVNDVIPPEDKKKKLIIEDEDKDIKQTELKEERLRSPYSDQNEFMLDKVKLTVLKAMGKAPASLDVTTISQEDAIKELSKVSLSEAEEEKFENAYIDELIKNEEQFQMLPPKLLTRMYTKLKTDIEKKQKADPKADVSKETAILERVDSRMNALVKDWADEQGFYFADITNIADVYEGYKEMLATRDQENADVKKANARLDELIGDYDEMWNLKDLTEKDAANLNNRAKQAIELLPKLDISKENMELLGKFRFQDAAGKDLPQFLDAKGNPQVDYKDGYTIAPDSRLNDIVKLAKNDELRKVIGSKEDITKDKLNASFNENMPFKLYEIYIADKCVHGALENPKQFTDKKFFNDFVNDLKSDAPKNITNDGYNAAISQQVNSSMGYIDRLGTKIGKDKDVLLTVHDQIKTFDKRAADRTTNVVDKKKTRNEQLKSVLKRGGIFLGSSFLITAAGYATGAQAAIAGTAIAAGIGLTAYQIYQRKKQAKARGEKYGIKEFFKDGQMLSTVAVTTLSVASVAFGTGAFGALAPNVEAAKACGYAAIGLASATAMVSSYKASRKGGLSKASASGWAALNGAIGIGASYLGVKLAHTAVDAYNAHNPSNSTFQHDGKPVKVGDEVTGEKDSFTYKKELADQVTARNNPNADTTFDYHGKGHDIPAYADPNNYHQNDWWNAQQHDNAIHSLKETMPDLGWKENSGNEEVMLRKMGAFVREFANPDFQLSSGKSIGETFTYTDTNGHTSNPWDAYSKMLNGQTLNNADAHAIHNVQFAMGEHGHGLTDVGIKPSELYSYDPSKPHGVVVDHEVTTSPVYETPKVPNESNGMTGAVGILNKITKPLTKFKDRIGSLADRIKKTPVDKKVVKEDPNPNKEPKVNKGKDKDPSLTPDNGGKQQDPKLQKALEIKNSKGR